MTSTVSGTQTADELAEIPEIEKVLLSFGLPRSECGPEDFRKLYRHYKPSLTSFAASSKASDPDGVADLALYDGYRALASMERRDYHGFRGYLFKAARSHLARERRRSLTVIPTAIDDELIGSGAEFESDLADSMALNELISDLPPDQQAVIRHRFFDGLTAEETGLLLGKKPNAVYQLQHRATRRLHRILLTALVLVGLIIGAAILFRQADTQVVDSSPARPDQQPAPQVDQPDPSGSTDPAPESLLTPENQDSPEVEGPGGISAGVDPEGAGDAVATTVATTPSSVATAETVVPEQDQPIQGETPSVDQPAPSTTTTVATTTTAAGPPTPARGAVAVARDDTLQARFGQPVELNVLANDSSPTISTDVVTVTSGGFDGLTLSADGHLTGTPTRVGYGTIVYRLTAGNGSSSLGIVRITVD